MDLHNNRQGARSDRSISIDEIRKNEENIFLILEGESSYKTLPHEK